MRVLIVTMFLIIRKHFEILLDQGIAITILFIIGLGLAVIQDIKEIERKGG